MRFRFGLFEFDARTGELRRDGVLVKLPPQPARVLALLLERPGQLILRDELQEHLWGGDTFVDFERGLNFCILQVRTALGDSAESPRFIQTVPRKGYRFIAPVVSEPPAAAVDRPVPAPDGVVFVASPIPRGNGRPRRVLAAVLALVIVAPVAWLATAARTTGPGRIRVAVLPVVNLTGDPALDYMADGVTDRLIAELGGASPQRLAVIARTSAMAYRQTTKSVIEIARELDVAFVIEGAISKSDEGVSIGASLARGADQAVVRTWRDTFGPPGVPHARIARDAALAILPESSAPNLPPPTANAEAWQAYLQGRAAMNRGTPEDVQRAIALFESAVASDRSFAGGWAQLAEAHHLLVMVGAAAPRDAYPAAAGAADRALALDASLGDAHLARGLVQLWYDWRPADAAQSFERALVLNGSHAAAHHDYAWSLVALGRSEDAVTHITTARDLDPLSARANTDIGWLYLHLRRPADAIRACRHTLAIQPRSLEAQACLERAAIQRGRADAASQVTWRTRLDALRQASETRWISPYTLAVHALMLGDTASAMTHLDAAVSARVGIMVLLDGDPALDPVRADPRFAALAERVMAARR